MIGTDYAHVLLVDYLFILTVGYLLHFPGICLGVFIHEIGHGLMAFFLTKDPVKISIGLGKPRKKLYMGRFMIFFSKFPWYQGKTDCIIRNNSIIRSLLILMAGGLFNLSQIFLSIIFITLSSSPLRCILLAWLLANTRVAIGSLYKERGKGLSDLEKIQKILARVFCNKNPRKEIS